jgi:hypothetical protein
MTKKEIKDVAKEMLVAMNNTPLEMDVSMDDQSLDVLSAKIVARFVSLKELTSWYNALHPMSQIDWDFLDITEEEEMLAELSKLMTLMNLFTDKEEYEKCSLLKVRIREIKHRLKRYEDDYEDDEM